MEKEMTTPEESVELSKDADGVLSISRAPGFSDGYMLTLTDDGGYTSFLLMDYEWPMIREKINKFIEGNK